MENSENKLSHTNYKWWKDTKMIGTILLIFTISMLVFAFLRVPFLSSINGYTIGMLLGYYSPLFYIFIIYKSLIMIFGNKVKLPKWVKLNTITYWILVISIVFISSSMGFYQSKNGFTSFGIKTWGAVENWFDDFTSQGKISAWVPNNTNGGFVGVFLYSFTAMIFSGIGALIVSIGALAISLSILLSGTSIGLYRDIRNRKKIELKKKELIENKQTNVDQFEFEEAKNMDENNKKNDSLPFEDPF